MGPRGRLCEADHDERQFDHSLVPIRHTLLLLWKDFPKVVEEQLGASTLSADSVASWWKGERRCRFKVHMMQILIRLPYFHNLRFLMVDCNRLYIVEQTRKARFDLN